MGVLLLAAVPVSLLLAPLLYVSETGPGLADLSGSDLASRVTENELPQKGLQKPQVLDIFEDALKQMDGHKREYLRNKQIVDELVTTTWQHLKRNVPLMRGSYLLLGGSSNEGSRVSNLSDFDNYLIIGAEFKDSFQSVGVMLNRSDLVAVVQTLKVPRDAALLQRFPEFLFLLDTSGTMLLGDRFKAWAYSLLLRYVHEAIPVVYHKYHQVKNITVALGESSLNIGIFLNDGTDIDVDFGALLEANLPKQPGFPFVDPRDTQCPLSGTKLEGRRRRLYLFPPEAVRKDEHHVASYPAIFTIDIQQYEKDILRNNEMIRDPVRLLKSIRVTRRWDAYNLPSFSLKHVVLHTFNTTCQTTDWSKTNMQEVLGKCLQTLHMSLQRGILPNFFTPTVNIWISVTEKGRIQQLTKDVGQALKEYMSGDAARIAALFTHSSE